MKSILIVDDHAFSRSVIEKMLRDQGYAIYSAGDGQEAVEIFGNHSIDLLITDLMMPKKNGFELMKELRELRPTLKIVAISSAPRNVMEWAVSFGAHATIEKSTTQADLLRVVRDLLA